MQSLSERVSYLKGLAEGMQLDTSSNEGKLIRQIIDVLGEMTDKLDALDEAYDELNDYVETIDDDLEALTMDDDDYDDDEDFDDDDEDDDEDFEFDDEDDDEDGAFLEDDDEDAFEDEDDEETDADMYAGCLCPECNGMFSIDVCSDPEQLFICPHCGKKVKAVPMSCKNVPIAQELFEEDDE